jgi:hypothetical protein
MPCDLGQVPTVEELCGIGLVMLGLVVHIALADEEPPSGCSPGQGAR